MHSRGPGAAQQRGRGRGPSATAAAAAAAAAAGVRMNVPRRRQHRGARPRRHWSSLARPPVRATEGPLARGFCGGVPGTRAAPGGIIIPRRSATGCTGGVGVKRGRAGMGGAHSFHGQLESSAGEGGARAQPSAPVAARGSGGVSARHRVGAATGPLACTAKSPGMSKMKRPREDGGDGLGGSAVGKAHKTAYGSSPRLTPDDALAYLREVKERFWDNRQVHLTLPPHQTCPSGTERRACILPRVNTTGVIKRVKELFKGHWELIVGFNAFLPKGYEIELPPQEQQNASKPPVEFDQAINYVNKIKEGVEEHRGGVPRGGLPVPEPSRSPGRVYILPARLQGARPEGGHDVP
eukprot:scaffold1786_cov398-Prasinococcus_capsulatus_cf.AAC.30